MLLKTFLRHPLRLIGRTLWLAGALFAAAMDHAAKVGLRGGGSSREQRGLWLQRNSRRVLRVINTSIRVTGDVPRRGLLISNHISYLDILVLAASAPSAFVSKAEVKNWPVFGCFARIAGTVFVKREKRSDVVRIADEIEQALDAGALLVLFPEGTTSNGETVLPFKSALLEPATQSKYPLHISAIGYSLADGSVRDEICYWGDTTLVPHLLNVLGKRALTAHVVFAPIVAPSPDRKQLAKQLRSEVIRLRENVSVAE